MIRRCRRSGSIEMGFMHWLRNYVFGSYVVGWLTAAVVVLLAIGLRIGIRTFIFRRLAHKRRPDKSETEYWRIHGENETGMIDAQPVSQRHNDSRLGFLIDQSAFPRLFPLRDKRCQVSRVM
jgi:hypothetical protein